MIKAGAKYFIDRDMPAKSYYDGTELLGWEGVTVTVEEVYDDRVLVKESGHVPADYFGHRRGDEWYEVGLKWYFMKDEFKEKATRTSGFFAKARNFFRDTQRLTK